MVGIFAKDGSLYHKQSEALSRDVPTLSNVVALALHGLGGSGVSAVRGALFGVPGGDAVRAATLDGRDSSRS